MATTFLLDPRVLDDTVLENTPAVEIVAEGFAYFRVGENSQPSYTFYQDTTNSYNCASLTSLHLTQSNYDGHHGDFSLRFQKANVIFLPLSDGEKFQWGNINEERRLDYLMACEVLYVHGKLVKGTTEHLNCRGVSIKL